MAVIKLNIISKAIEETGVKNEEGEVVTIFDLLETFQERAVLNYQYASFIKNKEKNLRETLLISFFKKTTLIPLPPLLLLTEL